jgi:ABC-type phosphate transport system substrate-binding protein
MSSLRGSASVLALSAAALFATSAARPAMAQPTQGIYAGGSTLASEAFRQIFDCYAGTTVGGDGFSFSSAFSTASPSPGLLPSTCTSATVTTQGVLGLYAGVGSGNGVRGFVSNNPDEWYGGTINTTSTAQTIATPFPAGQPPIVDSNNLTNFGTYPYPHIDIGLSDSPLSNVGTTANFTTVAFSFTPSTGWISGGVSSTQITLNSGSAVTTYTTSTYGKPIQVPAFEVNVAIAVNVNSPSVLQINSQIKSGGSIVPGGAIQLTAGQLCAIFSGLVTDWSDDTTRIPELDQNGNQLLDAGGLPVKFDHANVGSVSTAQPYANASLPINVVYRSDGSGTSFILTNYLHNVCPLLDPNNTAGYVSIFGSGTKTLPSTSFADLVTNIVNVRGNGVWNVATTTTTTTIPAWLGESGSGGVAATISDGAAQAGFIGYVSADFTKPYASVVSGAGLTNVDPPLEASLQNENLRSSATYVPSSGSSLTFVAPTPAAADAAWNDPRLQLPATTWTYADYNIYANNFIPGTTTTTTTTGTTIVTIPVMQSGVDVSNHSVLPLTNQLGAYPLSGTTFLDMYSCYNGTTRVTNLRNFLTWFLNDLSNGGDPDVAAVVQNAGFHSLPVSYSANIISEYLTANRAGLISAPPARGTPTAGCTGVTGGAN